LRKIFAPTRVEDWRKIQNEELHVFFIKTYSSDRIKKNEMDVACFGVGDRRDAWKNELWIGGKY
jgi:hypothetical protein